MPKPNFRILGVIALLAGGCLSVPAAGAEDILVLDKNDSAAVSGQITAIGKESLTLLSNGKEITVDTRHMNLDGDLSDVLEIGANVMVEGALDAKGIDAQRIVRTE